MIKLLTMMAAAFGTALLLSLLLTPMVRRWMTALKIVDQPNARRVNTHPIPRSGGLAIVGACFITWFLAYLFSETFNLGVHLTPTDQAFLGASFLLVCVGFWDDCKGLSALFRLLTQLLVAGVMYHVGVVFHLPRAWGAWTTSPMVTLPLTLLWSVGIINAFNLIDGLDGLASGLAMISS